MRNRVVILVVLLVCFAGLAAGADDAPLLAHAPTLSKTQIVFAYGGYLWSVPREGGIDLEFLAHRFKVSGGNIRNICVTAAYLAAADGRTVSMADLIRATEREYRKLGRLTVEAEFGKYFSLVAS